MAEMIRHFTRAARYAWASPATLCGLLFVPFVRISGGGYQVIDGVLELHGGLDDQILLLHPSAKLSAGVGVLFQQQPGSFRQPVGAGAA